MESGQFTRAEPKEFAGLSSVQQKTQRARELPRRACLEIDLAISIHRSSVWLRAGSLWVCVCAGGGVRERMRGARVSLACAHMELVRAPRAWSGACTGEVFTTFKHIAADL